jgi:serine protease Do
MVARRLSFLLLVLPLLTTGAALNHVRADEIPASDKPAPDSVEDLKAIQKQVKKTLEKVMPSVVGVRVGNSSGSGVIVTKDGYVLTAGHVSGPPNREVVIVFADGKTVKAKSLGGNHGVDSGLIKISEEGDWPTAEMGNSADLRKGQWCITIGHPGGPRKERTPPVRLGRILEMNDKLIRTDCTLVGGDSGGPLFDIEGKVIGIHSRIGDQITQNIHVPVDVFRDGWDRMVKAEVWGIPGTGNAAYMGVVTEPEGKECKILEVAKDSPAEKAGLKVDDVVLKFDGKKVEKGDQLVSMVSKKKPGEEVSLEVRRGEETITLKVKLGKRPG